MRSRQYHADPHVQCAAAGAEGTCALVLRHCIVARGFKRPGDGVTKDFDGVAALKPLHGFHDRERQAQIGATFSTCRAAEMDIHFDGLPDLDREPG
ncbi:hypothetical protein AB4Y40_41310 [Paraburkholderia sp. EG287B]|uniref:hypothetical protein n=1 Tax=Paraburkholderia sp. EG287B TaxID=3237010 RepID=UPI0034D174F1